MALLGWYGLFGGTVLVGVGFEVSRIQNRPSVSLLMTVNPDVEFTDTSLATCLLHTSMFLTMMRMNKTSESVSEPQLSIFFY